MHAVSSAALAMAVTRACTRGELEKCGCDRKVRGVSPEGEVGLYSMNMYQVSTSHTHTHTHTHTHNQRKDYRKFSK